MLPLLKPPSVPAWTDIDWVLTKAGEALSSPLLSITQEVCERSKGGTHDYYSNGDYWWPDPASVDGLPYIRRDGESNPGNFNAHRELMRGMRTRVVFLTAGFLLTGEREYAKRAEAQLSYFFLSTETFMAPHLTYAQAIPGLSDGRGIGIIDTLHLVDVVFATEKLHAAGGLSDSVYKGLKDWFAAYLGWMLTNANGIEEMNEKNNHAVCFFVQAAAFALFSENPLIVAFCRDHFKKVLLKQEALDGSFPRELARTKPYNYSLFIVDNMVSLCHLLSTSEENLWTYEDPEGRSIKKALDFITPYLADKTSWPYPPDVEHFDAFPCRHGFLFIAGTMLNRAELIDLWNRLPVESKDEEARRNIASRLPLLWM